MTWEEVCEHPSLRDLPFKIETNRYGQIVMSPAKNQHGYLLGKIVGMLSRLLPDGEVSTELAVDTPAGVKVTDVAWTSAALYRRLEPLAKCDVAPEICVEIISASNTAAGMMAKRNLYLGRGAKEVWLVDAETRRVRFYAAEGRRAHSALCPEFPAAVPR